MPEFVHQSVLLREVLNALQPQSGRLLLDGTLGGAGHSFAWLEASTPDGRLIGLDRDDIALQAAAEKLKPFSGRFELHRANFANLDLFAEPGSCDAVLLDLGVSSPQLDWASQIGTEPPQTYPRLQSHSPLAALQHCPWELHVSPVSQVLQALPQPSEPQPFLKQSGRQMHWPWGPHASFWPLQNPLNGPHRPPHPSEPHSLPVQSGVHVHWPLLHVSLASHWASVQQLLLGMHRFPHFFFPFLHFFFLAAAFLPRARGTLASSPASTRRRGALEPSTRIIASNRPSSMTHPPRGRCGRRVAPAEGAPDQEDGKPADGVTWPDRREEARVSHPYKLPI